MPEQAFIERLALSFFLALKKGHNDKVAELVDIFMVTVPQAVAVLTLASCLSSPLHQARSLKNVRGSA